MVSEAQRSVDFFLIGKLYCNIVMYYLSPEPSAYLNIFNLEALQTISEHYDGEIYRRDLYVKSEHLNTNQIRVCMSTPANYI